MCRCNRRNRSTPEAPTMLGAPDGQPALRVRAAVSFSEIRYNELAWVAGDQVARYVDAGYLTVMEA